uniref:Uncharacterized protein n=1 Tax=Anguilla anguilla TaxID=7936 RepID=A0A0E9RTJ9_ANGAN
MNAFSFTEPPLEHSRSTRPQTVYLKLTEHQNLNTKDSLSQHQSQAFHSSFTSRRAGIYSL